MKQSRIQGKAATRHKPQTSLSHKVGAIFVRQNKVES